MRELPIFGSTVYEGTTTFFGSSRSAYMGFWLLNVSKCQRESAHALPCNSAAANTVYGTILM